MIAPAASMALARPAAAELGEDREWLAVLAVLTAVEGLWWALLWEAGLAPLPYLGAYAVLTGAALLAAWLVRLGTSRGEGRASATAILGGACLVAIGASLFLPLKYAIPSEVPFWLDQPLAAVERALFGTDPWLALDRLFGWALVPVDRIYGLWLPVQSVALFAIVLLPPSPAKSRALIAYGLAWFLLGIVAATLCASVGPVFFDRLFHAQDFAALAARLHRGGAAMALTESDAMWRAFDSAAPGLVAGMSAMPSLHVAISLWLWLSARALAPKLAPLALAYTGFMWLASVQLGWHYASDGLAALLGMAGVWWVAGKLRHRLARPLAA